jgi:uncharacterized protein YeaO (DUF488 family)
MNAMPRRYASPACSMPEIETAPHPLSWKRVYDQPTPGDGRRVLIDRLWPRGIRKQDLTFDEWWKDLAPSTELRKWFGHDPARWEEFRHRYAAELAARPQALVCLREALQRGPVTLLTASRNEHCNHAVALMEVIGNPP